MLHTTIGNIEQIFVILYFEKKQVDSFCCHHILSENFFLELRKPKLRNPSSFNIDFPVK